MNNDKQTEISKFLDYCRHQQKEFAEKGAELSGVDFLRSALEEGVIDMVQFREMYEAVVDYKREYIIL